MGYIILRPYQRSWKRNFPCHSLPFSDKRIERCSTWLWRVSCDRKFNKFHINNHIRKHEFERREKLSQGFQFVLIFLRIFSRNQIGPMIHLKTRFRAFIAWLFHSLCNPAYHMNQGFTKTRKIMTYDSQVHLVIRNPEIILIFQINFVIDMIFVSYDI